MNNILIKTKKFGDVKVDMKNVFVFPQGIFGFEENKKFALLNFGQKDFYWLQSLDNEEISLMVTSPFYFTLGYKERIEKEDTLYRLNCENYLVFVGCYYDKADKKIFANILAPFLMDKDFKTGRQVILNGNEKDLKVDVVEKIKETAVKCLF